MQWLTFVVLVIQATCFTHFFDGHTKCEKSLTIYESFLLFSGDSFILRTNICWCRPNIYDCTEHNITANATATAPIKTDFEDVYDPLEDYYSRKLEEENKEYVPPEFSAFKSFDFEVIFTFEKPNGEVSVVNVLETDYVKPRVYRRKANMIISFAKPVDTGIYKCLWRKKVRFIVDITVQEPAVEPIRFIKMNQRSLSPKTLPLANLEVFTHWTADDRCSYCFDDDKSFRYYLGTCKVKVLNKHIPILPYALSKYGGHILINFKEGIACRSHLIHRAVEESGFLAIRRRPTELKVAKCDGVCGEGPKNPDFEKIKKIVETPAFISKTVYERSKVHFSCPRKQPSFYPVYWYDLSEIADKMYDHAKKAVEGISGQSTLSYLNSLGDIISPIDFVKNSRGRKIIDPGGNLVIFEAKPDLDGKKTNSSYSRKAVYACGIGDVGGKGPETHLWTGVYEITFLQSSFFINIIHLTSQALHLASPLIISLVVAFFFTWIVYVENTKRARMYNHGRSHQPRLF